MRLQKGLRVCGLCRPTARDISTTDMPDDTNKNSSPNSNASFKDQKFPDKVTTFVDAIRHEAYNAKTDETSKEGKGSGPGFEVHDAGSGGAEVERKKGG